MEAEMNATLTPEQLQALADCSTEPIRLIDPQSQQAYVLVRADEYDQLLELVKDDYNLRDTYAAQLRSAMRAGWGDPAMDDYNDYDANFEKLCRSREATSSLQTCHSAT
jgi:hypothetical protein